MQSVQKALFVIEKTREIGRIDGRILAKSPGWDRVQACRYLNCLANAGWLEKVSAKGRPLYVLGPKVLHLAVDLRF
jgi:DNA-binding IclR family transcriptional regulator